MPRTRSDGVLGRRWVIPEPDEQTPIPDTPYPAFVTTLLRRRGIADAEAAAIYLFDQPSPEPDATLLPGAMDAVERIARAVEEDEAIAVYGDFDVDGVTSAAIMTEAIRAVGGHVTPFIPDRFTDGYGLHTSALGWLRRERNVSLVVTADCGITSIREVEYAREIGQDVVILDHHSVPSEIPEAAATVNPKLPGSAYPFDEFSTGGLAYRLAPLLLDRFGKRAPDDQWLDLAALSTVADVVPLVGENRRLVARGLIAIRETTRPGLRALLEVAGLWDQELDADSIGYGLAPRINAAGRLDHALRALTLLTETDPDRAAPQAKELDRLNLRRRQATLDAMACAEGRLSDEDPAAALTFVGDAAIPAGIVGLVAGRLAEDRHRPAIVYEERPEQSRASCRSIAEFDMAAALRECSDLLLRYGGHAMAAGFTVRTADLPALKQRLTALADEQLAGVDLQPRLELDGQVSLARVGASQVAWLQRLAPFGEGNPVPTFVSEGVELAEARRVGVDGAHLRLKLRDGGQVWPAIGFRLGHAPVSAGDRVDVVWSLKRNGAYGGMELEIKDLAPTHG